MEYGSLSQLQALLQENGWTWDIHFNTSLASIEAGDYKAVHYFSTMDALEVDTYNGGFQNNTYNYIYPDEFDKVTTFNVQKEGDIYCITMIGSGGYGNDDDAAIDAADPADVYGQYIEMGARMIQTDRPEMLIRYLRSIGRHD